MKYYWPQSTGEQQQCWEKGMQLEQCNYTISDTMNLKQNQLIVVYGLVGYMYNTTFIFLIYFCCKETKDVLLPTAWWEGVSIQTKQL